MHYKEIKFSYITSCLTQMQREYSGYVSFYFYGKNWNYLIWAKDFVDTIE